MSSFLRAFLLLNARVIKAVPNANNDAAITRDRVLQESFIDQYGTVIFYFSILIFCYVASKACRSVDRVLTARRERREQRANEMANQLAKKEAEKRRKDILVSFQKNKLERVRQRCPMELKSAIRLTSIIFLWMIRY